MTLTEQQVREIREGCEGVQGGPWKLDKFAAYVWAPSEKGGDFPLMDEPGEHGRVIELRGWGYYTGNGSGALALAPDEAERRQRLTGEHVARMDPATVSALCDAWLENAALRVERAAAKPIGWRWRWGKMGNIAWRMSATKPGPFPEEGYEVEALYAMPLEGASDEAK